ncbi:hypothetical protein EV426DRAFT_704240 [Tirmania nivea]|nr:hypothetical protein EV426DRAFT_704240 [Tirmania nivea]
MAPGSVLAKRAGRSSSDPIVENIGKSSIRVPDNLLDDSLVEPKGRRARLFCHLTRARFDSTPQYSPVDFESLPPAVRRKMFSSQERLRMALGQYQLGHGRTLSSSHSQDSSRSSSSRGKFKKSSPADAFALSQVDAQWFLNLPETVKRKHFTREERLLLECRCQSVIMDAADETIFRMGNQANRSCGTLDSFTSTVSQRTTADPPSPSDIYANNDLSDWRTSFRWLDEGDDLDLRLNIEEFHHSYLEKPLPRTSHSDNSRRRSLSLSAKPNPKPPTPPYALNGGRRCSYQLSSARPSFSGAPRNSTQIDSEATYYQDPEARLKLRVYLASAQKFDEAVEFGFPSNKDGRPATSHTGGHQHTFHLQDESFLDDDDDKRIPSYNLGAKQLSRSISGNPLKPTLMASHYPLTSPGNREMTLRMTLTRPDLRADESQLYGWKKEAPDPLALEPLPAMSDVDAGMGPFDIPPWARDENPGLVRKLWRKVKLPISLRR